MKIPNIIEIEVVDRKNKSVEKEILMGMKIYKDSESWYNFSPFKTEKNGKVKLTMKQIFESIDSSINPETFIVEKIEIVIWNCDLTNVILNSIKNYNLITEDQIKNDLINRGFDENLAIKYSKTSFQKILNDIQIWSQYSNVENCTTSFEETLIIDNSEIEKKYRFVIN